MPGPERPAHRGWLGVMTGIRLIQITTTGLLVLFKFVYEDIITKGKVTGHSVRFVQKQQHL